MAELFCWLTAHRKGRALGPERRWGGGDFSAYLQIKKGSPCAELFSQNSSALSTPAAVWEPDVTSGFGDKNNFSLPPTW